MAQVRHVILNIGIFIVFLSSSFVLLGNKGIIPSTSTATIGIILGALIAIFPLLPLILHSNNTYAPPNKGNMVLYGINIFMLLLLIIISLFDVLIPPNIINIIFPRCILNDGSKTVFSSPKGGIGIVRASDGECIGISDGSFSFDVKHQDTKNVEQLIYQENQDNADQPHLTIVVATMLSKDDKSLGVGRDDLQGAYVAQQETDGDCILRQTTTCLTLHILIANIGSNGDYAPQIAQQIIELKQSDSTFVGVMGLPFSGTPTIKAIKILADEHIPIVSPSASSDDLTNPTIIGDSSVGYFNRIVPPNSEQGYTAAQYANTVLRAHHIAVFEDSANSYSHTLANSFKQNLANINSNIEVAPIPYKKGQRGTIGAALDQSLHDHPNLDLIFFAGYADDLNNLLDDLDTVSPAQRAKLRIMGGDALYELAGYSQYNFKHIYFTAFAYPDETSVTQSPLKEEYPKQFGPTPAGKSPYGFERTDSGVILSYDAMTALARGSHNMLVVAKQPTPENLHEALQNLAPFQGASGQISFAQSGDPIKKPVLVLCVAGDGTIHLSRVMIDGRLEVDTAVFSACH